VPILSVTGIWEASPKDPQFDGHTIGPTSMQHNFRPLLKLMAQHNVKLALSGHMHMVDEIEYLGIKLCCNGAVCGKWWNGPHLEFAEGYGIVDLHADGTVENRYVSYGWKAPTPPAA
jgi:hypothetical protein